MSTGELAFVVWFLSVVLATLVGVQKKNILICFLCGVLFGPFGLFLAFFQKHEGRFCPFCRKEIDPQATVCPYCQGEQFLKS